MAFEFVSDVEFEAKHREYKGGPTGPKPRTEEQKPWDEHFKNAMNTTNVVAVQVVPDAADTARKHINSAARYFERAVTEGVAKPGNVEGTVILTWKIRIPKVRGPRKTTTEATAE